VTSGTIATVDIATDHESLGRSVAVGANYYKYIILRSELEYIEPQTVKKESEKMANTEKKSSQKKTASRAITNLGRVIFMCRSILGLSVREMAEEIGLSHATVSRIENGHQVDAETLMKIMNWFVSKSEDSGTPFQSAVQSISFSLIRRDKRVVIKKS
jgi:DNA-binding XRE family transcriptional regulator